MNSKKKNSRFRSKFPILVALIIGLVATTLAFTNRISATNAFGILLACAFVLLAVYERKRKN